MDPPRHCLSDPQFSPGGTDSSKFTGTITYTYVDSIDDTQSTRAHRFTCRPITGTSPALFYWGINESITYGSATGTTVLATTAGIVDTGAYLSHDIPRPHSPNIPIG